MAMLIREEHRLPTLRLRLRARRDTIAESGASTSVSSETLDPVITRPLLSSQILHGEQAVSPWIDTELETLGISPASYPNQSQRRSGSDLPSPSLAALFTQNPWSVPTLAGAPIAGQIAGLAQDAQGGLLWLHIAQDSAPLALLPWEAMIRPLTRVPFVRIPNFLNAPFKPTRQPTIVICASAPIGDGPYAAPAFISAVVRAILSAANGAHATPNIHVFVDQVIATSAEAVLAPLPPQVHVHHYTPSEAQSDPRNGRDIWMDWIVTTLNGQSADIVHFISPGYLGADYGAIVLAGSPIHNDRKGTFIGAADLARFYDRIGCTAMAFSNPAMPEWVAGQRSLAFELSWMRAGPIVLTEASHPSLDALVSVYSVFFGRGSGLARDPFVSKRATAIQLPPRTLCSAIHRSCIADREIRRGGRVCPQSGRAARANPLALVHRAGRTPWQRSCRRLPVFTGRTGPLVNPLCPTRVAIEAEIEPGGQSTLKFKVTSGPPLPLRSFPVSLDSDPVAPFIAMPPNAVIPNSIELAGRALWSGLDQDPNFAPSYDQVANTAAPDRGIVIHIPAYAAMAHNFPWEILHTGSAFVAPAGVAFVRTVEPRAGAERVIRVLDGNLRFLSIIAAAGVDGINEWTALQNAFAGYALPLERLVLVSDPQLKSTIEQQPDPPAVEMVPVSETDLLARTEHYAPHICHIFCHGSPLGLQVANNNTEYGARPLNISGQLLASSLRSAWLVCLVACATGAVGAEAGTSTVGSELVEAGVPFVTCMRENVPADAASQFTGSFLSAVFTDLSAKAGQQNFPLKFDDAMTRARTGLALWKNDPQFNLTKEWTLPILCTVGRQGGPSEFLVTRPANPASAFDLVATIRQISDLQAALASGSFEAQRGAIEAKIAELTQQMAGAPPQGQA